MKMKVSVLSQNTDHTSKAYIKIWKMLCTINISSAY